MAAVIDWSPVFEQVKETMFFILVAPQVGKVDNIWRECRKRRNVRNTIEVQERINMTHVCNGFVVEKRNDTILILTCAHALEHVFTASQPLSVEQANDMFEFTLVCDHYESAFRAAGHAGERGEDTRRYVCARVAAISCANDLLLIKVKEEDLKKALSQDEICGENHRIVEISEEIATVGERAMLISWPSHKHRTTTEGIVGVRRTIDEISLTNVVGYSMEILEGNIDSEKGASGAPLFNGSGKVIGLVHAGFGKSHTYFVPSDTIKTFLTSFSADEVKNTLPEEKRKGKDKEEEGPSAKRMTGRRSARIAKGRSSTIT